MTKELDLNLTQSYVKHIYGSNIGPNNSLPFDTFRVWERNKKDLFKLLNNNLILEKEISIDKDYYLIEQEMFHLKNTSTWFYQLQCKFYDLYSCDYSKQFITGDMLIMNKYIRNSFEYNDPNVDKKSFKISRGEKPLKILRKLTEYYDMSMDDYEEFRLEHSRILNNKKLKGTLCLSIHPLDFFTMSDNENHWESCMSWKNNGCNW